MLDGAHKMQENLFGTLSIFTFVTLPDGREKRATLAIIDCEYAERKDKFLAFQMANPNIVEGMHLGARFTFSDWVSIH
jgi:hypothetical protein